MLSTAGVLFRIAVANIFSSLLNVFVGLVLLFGAALLVLGGSLFSTLDDSLSKSIVDSLTGHFQVYSARSKDPLEIYGKVDGSDSNLSAIDDFQALKATLMQVPNVERVVPMGAATALVGSGNTVDVTLEKLRSLYRAQADAATRLPEAEFTLKSDSLKGHVRNIVQVLAQDMERAAELTVATALEAREREALQQAMADEFWASFDAAPLDRLEFLENRIAPQVADADLLFMRYVGTDLSLYQDTFGRMSIVEGGPVPAGKRGLLLPRFFYEEFLKLKSARRLDKIKSALEAGRKLSDTDDKELQRFVRENQAQTREFVLQLDGLATAQAVERLERFLGEKGDLPTLLQKFFVTTDANFAERYDFFYKQLGPLLSLYRAKVGEKLTLRSIGSSGSMESATITLYGIFELKGLEKSPLAGVNALVDLVTFRDLYGFMTAEKQAELDAMKAETQVKQVSRDDAEAALFGDDATLVEDTQAKSVAVAPPPPSEKTQEAKRARRSDTYSPDELQRGVVLNAAVLVKDSSALAMRQTQLDLERALAKDKAPPSEKAIADAKALLDGGKLPFALAATLKEALAVEEARLKGEPKPANDALLALQGAFKAEKATLDPAAVGTVSAFLQSAKPKVWVVGWSSAAGFLGKFIDFFRLLLAGIVGAFAFIALIVVTIGMTIATLQRTSTIGTMRAIGAQRGFVVSMVLAETVVLALVFGLLGSAIGALGVLWLHARGIPAFRDELYFFFSGPVLRPVLTGSGVVLALVVTQVVGVLAVLFPTFLATRVQPVVAMRGSE